MSTAKPFVLGGMASLAAEVGELTLPYRKRYDGYTLTRVARNHTVQCILTCPLATLLTKGAKGAFRATGAYS